MTQPDRIAEEIDRIDREVAEAKKRGFPSLIAECFGCDKIFKTEAPSLPCWLDWEKGNRKPSKRYLCPRCEKEDGEEE